jgi:hypothetical protein
VNSKSGELHLKNSIFASKVGNEHASMRKKGYLVGEHSLPNRVRQQYLLKMPEKEYRNLPLPTL